MGEYNQALGMGATVEALGETWTVSPLGPGIRAAFEQWLEDSARKAVSFLRDDLEAYAACMKAVVADIVAQRYKWYGVECLNTMNTVTGAAYLLHLCLKPNHPKVTPTKCEDLLEANGNEFRAVLNMHADTDRKNRGLPPLTAGTNGASTTSAPSSSVSLSPAGITSGSPA